MTAQWDDTPEQAVRIAQLANVIVDYGETIKLQREIHQFRWMARELGGGGLMTIKAPTGWGKTTVVENYIDTMTKEGNGSSLLYLKLPVKCTSALLEENLLNHLGDPQAEKRKLRYTRLVELLRAKGKTTLFFDEASQIIDRDSNRVIYQVADTVKLLIEDDFAVVLIGLPSLERIIRTNKQLVHRRLRNPRIGPFGWETAKDLRVPRVVLAMISAKLPFPKRPTLGDPEIAEALVFAGHGLIGEMMLFVIRAGELSIRSPDSSTIGLEHLSAAFEELRAEDDVRENPFDQLLGLTVARIADDHAKQKRAARKSVRMKSRNPRPPTLDETLTP